MGLLITLNKEDRQPLNRQIYEEVRKLILSGALSPGQKLPSTRELADSLEVSRATSTLAYEQLMSEGYIETFSGQGTFVTRELPENLMFADGRLTSKKPLSGNSFEQSLSEFGRYVQAQGDTSTQGRLLRTGSVAFDQIPLKQWRKLLNQHFDTAEYALFEYAKDSAGYLPLREAIARYLCRSRGITCDADQVIVVNGSQQALDLIGRIQLDRGDAVAFEDPGYFGAQRTFSAYGGDLHPIPVDQNGMQINVLEESKARFKIAYVTPSHQYPTGVVMPLARRIQLLQWADRAGALIVEDDYDSEYRYGGRPIPALHGLDNQGVVLYTGTVSKLLFPALRLGYLVVPKKLVKAYTWAKRLADHSSPLLEQSVLAEFIEKGYLESHIRRMRALYERRRETLSVAMAEHVGSMATILGENAGLHIAVSFNCDLSEETITEMAQKAGVEFRSIRPLYLSDRAPGREFVFGYANLSEEYISERIESFGKTLKAACRQGAAI